MGEMSFVIMSTADVTFNATDAVFSLLHVGGLYLVMFKAHICDV